jgi:hypothetical protein
MIKFILNLSFFLLITNLNFGQKTADEYFNIAEKADLNNHQLKIDNYSKAIELNPSMSEAYFKRGLSKQILGIEDACDDFYKSCGLGYIDACNKYNDTKNSNCRIKFKDKISPRFGLSSAYSSGNDIDLRVTTIPKKSIGFYFAYKVNTNYFYYSKPTSTPTYNYNGFFNADYIFESSWGNGPIVLYEDISVIPVLNNDGTISTHALDLGSLNDYPFDMSQNFPNGGLSYGNDVHSVIYEHYGIPQIGLTKSIKEKIWISLGYGLIIDSYIFEERDYFNSLNNDPYGRDFFYNPRKSSYNFGSSFQFSLEFLIKKHFLLRYGLYNISDLIIHEFGLGFSFKSPKRKKRKI